MDAELPGESAAPEPAGLEATPQARDGTPTGTPTRAESEREVRYDRERRTQTVCLAILTTIAIAVALFWLRPVMIPFVLAVFFSYALTPVIDFIVGHLRAPRQVAIAAALLLSFVLLFLSGGIVTSAVAEMAANRASYQKQMTALAYRTYDQIDSLVPLHNLGVTRESLRQFVGAPPPGPALEDEAGAETGSAPSEDPGAAGAAAAELAQDGGADQTAATPEPLVQEQPPEFGFPRLDQLPLAGAGEASPTSQNFGLRGILGTVLSYATSTITRLASQGTLVMIFVVFLLIGRKPRTERREGVWGDIEARVKRYIIAKVGTSATTGILTWMILSVLGVDLAIVFGFSAFLLNFIPSVGSMIATVLPLPVVLFSPELSTTTAVLAIVLPGAVQFTIGNVLEPKWMGNTLDLHPVVILLGLIFWGMIWGLVGMFLATPIMAVVKILLERIDVTAPMAEMLAGRLDEAERRSHI